MIDRTQPLKLNLAERLAEFDDTWAPKISPATTTMRSGW